MDPMESRVRRPWGNQGMHPRPGGEPDTELLPGPGPEQVPASGMCRKPRGMQPIRAPPAHSLPSTSNHLVPPGPTWLPLLHLQWQQLLKGEHSPLGPGCCAKSLFLRRKQGRLHFLKRLQGAAATCEACDWGLSVPTTGTANPAGHRRWVK